MARLFRRSILWLVPVVVIPLGALLVVQYQFLRTLESKTVSAERSWLRDSAEVVAGDIDQYYRTSALKALSLDRSCLCDSRAMGEHFRGVSVNGARGCGLFQSACNSSPAAMKFSANSSRVATGEWPFDSSMKPPTAILGLGMLSLCENGESPSF